MEAATLTRTQSPRSERNQEREDLQAKGLEQAKELLPKIKAEHEAAKKDLESGLEHAIKCGKYLSEAKKLVKHGEWEAWVKANCDFSLRTASNYRKVSWLSDTKKLPGREEISYSRAIYALRRDPKEPGRKKRKPGNNIKLKIPKEKFEDAIKSNHLDENQEAIRKMLKTFGIVIG